jgi:hypothetical protein
MSEAIATQEFDAQATALEDFDVSSAKLMQADQHWAFFARLRDEAPVHYCRDSMFGPYWSITRFADIMEIEKNWQEISLVWIRQSTISNGKQCRAWSRL